MEKFKLKALQLGAKALLTREEMKNVNGGGTGCYTSQCYVIQGPGICAGNGINTPCSCYVYGQYYPAQACAHP